MRRRRFLQVGTAGLVAGAAGCTGLEVPSVLPPEDRHPLAGATATVRIDDHSDTDHDVEANAREALAYWVEHAPEYAGFDVDFEVATGDDPDLAIEYVDSPEGCRDVEGYSERVLGCAPLVRPGQRLRGTARAVVVAGARPFGKIRITTKHELGHILGLGHADPPAEIMSDRPEDRIPLYDVRIDVWETVLAAKERGNAASDLFREGVEAWNAEDYATAETSTRAASEAFAGTRGDFERARARTDEFEGHPRVETVDLAGVRGHLDALTARMTVAEDFSDRMAEASAAAASGRYAEANRHLSRANERIEAFNAMASPGTGDVAVALGLVRGVDREDDVVGAEDEV